MSLVFYYIPMSTASLTEAVLAELDVPCERVKLAGQSGATSTPEFLAINPNGRVPVIVHDGVPIWESCAITMYLGEMFGVEFGLYPAPGPRRGEAMKWIAWANVTLGEAGMRLAHTGEEQARGDIAERLKVLDGGLEGKPFLLGDYTLADTHLHGVIAWFGMMGVDFSHTPNIGPWATRCGERPALAKLMASWREGTG